MEALAPELGERGRDEGLYRRLLETAPDAMLVIDEHGKIAFVNQQTERLFGYRREQLLGAPFEVLIPERLRGAHESHVARYFSRPVLRPMGLDLEVSGLCADGREIPLEISLSPHETAEGTRVSVAIRDVSSRRALEAEARLAAQRLASAVAALEDAFALFDASDHLVVCNRAYAELYRQPPGSLIGRGADELLEAWLSALEFRTVAEREDFVAERRSEAPLRTASFDVQTVDGRWLRVLDRATAEDGRVRTVWDLTDERRRAAALEEARAEADAANAAKSEFLSSMSHELRTPLNAILGFAQLMQRDGRDPLSDRHRHRIVQILQGGEHLLRLIDDILDLARVEAGGLFISVEPVDPVEVMREVMTTLEPAAARAGIRLELGQLPPDLPSVSVDRTRFAQILMNFGSNAVKYNVNGGRARFIVSVAADRLRVTVSDSGIGIPLDRQASVFKPFQRAGQEAGPIEGTGIGLSITKRLAELMHGEVGFQSKPGEGSSFWVEVPLHQKRATSTAPPRDHGGISRLSARRRRILYVEDNPANLLLMRELLAHFEEIELVTAGTGEAGVELACTLSPDLVLMDINLPKMDGLAALAALRALPATRSTPVVALTAAASDGERRRALAAGFERYVVKPIRIAELEGLLRALLAG